jgi:serine/threonine-protein kinase HipA
MMEMARQLGMDVPQTALVPLDQIQGIPHDLGNIGNHAFIIERFDRKKGGEKVHIEDFAQVFSVYPEKKYQAASYRNIAEVIWTEIGEKGIIEFIRRFVFNALIGNGDMHLKNWSLIYPDQRKAALAPAYDFVSTIPYLPSDSLALSFAGSKSFQSLTRDQFQRFANKANLPERLVLQTVKEMVERFKQTWPTINDLPMNQEMMNAIEKHMKTIPIYSG